MNQQKHPLSSEPGRRYAAGRVRPRAGSDIAPRNTIRPVAHLATEPPAYKQPTTVHVPTPDIKAPITARKPSTAKPALPRQNRSHVLKRHMVERAVEHRRQVRGNHGRRIAGLLAAFLIIGAILIIIFSFWDFKIRSISIPFIHNQDTPAATQNNTPKMGISRLEEVKPTSDDIEAYLAAADAPRVLRIPRLDVESRVKRVGISLNGEPISPSNIYDVGWFDDGGKPGQPGAVFINGHVAGSTKKGVFHSLATLQVGDEIQIERGDTKVLTYVVVKVQPFSNDQVDMDVALESIDSSKNGLNLVTSSANYDGANKQNSERVIVFAVQQ